YQVRSGNIPFSWSISFSVLVALFLFFGIYHKFILPRPPNDQPGGSVPAASIPSSPTAIELTNLSQDASGSSPSPPLEERVGPPSAVLLTQEGVRRPSGASPSPPLEERAGMRRPSGSSPSPPLEER